MADLIYALCALTAFLCCWLLLRAYSHSHYRLLLWGLGLAALGPRALRRQLDLNHRVAVRVVKHVHCRHSRVFETDFSQGREPLDQFHDDG